MEDGIFFNQSKYIKEMLKKFGLKDSKPMKTPMSSDTKLTKDEECESVDSTKYRGMIGTMHLGLWYPKGTDIETIIYADSDHVGDYVDRKSTSGICTFVGCCLTSWFSKKQTALAISNTESEYVSAGKACQQALWMKQTLIDNDIRLDDIPIMCDNKGAIDLSKNPVQHSRTKHIEIHHHFLCDNVQKGHSSFCSKGLYSTLWVDYEETFSPVADIRAIRILISIAAFYDYEIWQMDKSMQASRSIYGLKQASRSWNKRFDEEIKRCTRPSIAFAQNMTSRFQQNLGELHWTAVKNILKYLRNTKDMFLVYGGNPGRELIRVDSLFCQQDFETDIDDMKSLTGYISF
ncbi:hypothetical protein Tco_1218502 [Tanacetum coccineum]